MKIKACVTEYLSWRYRRNFRMSKIQPWLLTPRCTFCASINAKLFGFGVIFVLFQLSDYFGQFISTGDKLSPVGHRT